MKKYILSLAVFIILWLTSVCFSQWTQIGPNYGSNSFGQLPILNSLYVLNDTLYGANSIFGMHYSTDAGITWCETGLQSGNVQAVAKSGNTIIAGSNKILRSTNNGLEFYDTGNPGGFLDVDAKGNLAIAGSTTGIFVSTDQGYQWSRPITSGTYPCVAISGTTMLAGTINGVYVSTNSGSSFTLVLTPRNVTSIVVSGSTVYACSNAGIDYSTNQGVTWNVLTSAYSFKTITIKGSDIYGAVGSNILKSSNNGVNWAQVYFGGSIVNDIASDNNYVYALINSAFFRSSNGGSSWTEYKYHFMQAYSIYKTPTALFTSTNNLGIYRSTNEGIDWFNVTHSSGFSNVRTIAGKNGTLFAGTDAQGVYTSINDGVNWSTSSFNNRIVYTIYTGEVQNILAGTYAEGVWVSQNNGANWFQSNLNNKTIYAIAGNGTKVFAGGTSTGVYVSDNSGVTWVQSYFNGQTVGGIVTLGNYVFAGGGTILSVSSNNGTTWSQSTFPAYIISLAVSGNAIFACTETNGIFVTQNLGLNWRNVNLNLGPRLSTSRLLISGNDLYGATYTNSVIKSPISNLVSVPVSIGPEIPDKFYLNQNYPNPFNPNTVISYKLSVAGLVTLKVYDLIGNEIAELVNYKQEAGSYSVAFDAGKYNLSSGIYFYKMSVNDFVDTKRMVLVK